MKATIMGSVALRKYAIIVLSIVLLLSIATLHAVPATVTAVAGGDYFNYHETETLSNGTGSYAGYSNNLVATGGETMTSISGSTVSANYSYSYSFNDISTSTTATMAGSYTWNDSSFLYISGTDNEQGYTNPAVWFAMNTSVPVGGTFTLLDTTMTVMSKDYNFNLPTENKDVATIFAQGTGSYIGSPQNNAYGNFSAKYTWNAYFDPVSGYIVGYHYIEQDTSTNGNGTGFDYVDDLYVTSTSYPLTSITATTTELCCISTTGSIESTASTSSSSTTITSVITTPPTTISATSVATIVVSNTDYITAIITVVVVIIAVIAITSFRRSKENTSSTSTTNVGTGTQT